MTAAAAAAAAARVLALRIATLLFCSAVAVAASGEPAEREYDVEHLLTPIPDFEDGISLIDETGSGESRRPETSPEQRVLDVERWVKIAVARPGVGATPRVDLQTKRLRVSLQEIDHKRLARVIERDRVRQQTIVRLEARILGGVELREGPDAEALRDKLALAMLPGAAGVALNGDAEVKQLLDANGNRILVTAPRMTLFNGQRAYVIASTQRAYVKGYSHRPGNPAGEWLPEDGVTSSGVLVDARPAAGANGNVALSLRVEFVHFSGFKTVPVTGVPADAKLEVQVPERAVMQVNTTTNIQDGGSHLFYLGAAPDDKHVERHHFLVLKATVNPPAAAVVD